MKSRVEIDNTSITFYVPIKPLSYNGYYRNTRTGKRVKTGAGHEYDEALTHYISDYADEIDGFFSTLGEDECIRLKLVVGKSNYYTEKGAVHKRSGDISNTVKVIEDKVFSHVTGFDDYIVKSVVLDEYPCDDDFFAISFHKIPHNLEQLKVNWFRSI